MSDGQDREVRSVVGRSVQVKPGLDLLQRLYDITTRVKLNTLMNELYALKSKRASSESKEFLSG